MADRRSHTLSCDDKKTRSSLSKIKSATAASRYVRSSIDQQQKCEPSAYHNNGNLITGSHQMSQCSCMIASSDFSWEFQLCMSTCVGIYSLMIGSYILYNSSKS
ncbi:hypothetical protein L6452_02562 [Arctium lappa]|uniref:Uncharacterized protein n=1 Tax=Arctium lappa TaxID=4217 RepID=A0ACB9FJ74_ARCLA|nr:hypothetical protein L6452_02562 [Arctium lappa]